MRQLDCAQILEIRSIRNGRSLLVSETRRHKAPDQDAVPPRPDGGAAPELSEGPATPRATWYWYGLGAFRDHPLTREKCRITMMSLL